MGGVSSRSSRWEKDKNKNQEFDKNLSGEVEQIDFESYKKTKPVRESWVLSNYIAALLFKLLRFVERIRKFLK